MEELTSKMPFLLGFLGGTLLFNMAFGDKATQMLLVLIFLSMIVLQADKITKFIGKVNAK